MTRPVKTPRCPRTALLRVRIAQERLKLADAERHDRKLRRAARQHAAQLARVGRDERMRAITARIEAGGFGNRPATPEEERVRRRIEDEVVKTLGWES